VALVDWLGRDRIVAGRMAAQSGCGLSIRGAASFDCARPISRIGWGSSVSNVWSNNISFGGAPPLGVSGLALSFWMLVALRQQLVLTLFRFRQQSAELRSSSELRKQRVGLQGAVSTIVVFDSTLDQTQGGILFTTV
jgi:hypothetical protein